MKWYEDPVYLKMCDCDEVQSIAPKCLTDNGRFLYARFGDNLYVRVGGEPNNEGFYSEHKLVWLPRQGQLQEMLEENNPVSLIIDLEEWTSLPMWIQLKPSRKAEPLAEEFYANLNRLTSMEQLWLAFVMKEKYNKVWDGEDWVKEVG